MAHIIPMDLLTGIVLRSHPRAVDCQGKYAPVPQGQRVVLREFPRHGLAWVGYTTGVPGWLIGFAMPDDSQFTHDCWVHSFNDMQNALGLPVVIKTAWIVNHKRRTLVGSFYFMRDAIQYVAAHKKAQEKRRRHRE